MRRKFPLLVNLVAPLFAWQISHIRRVSADDKVDAVTTSYSVYGLTKAVTGDTADATILIEAGTEPHDFEPSTKNIVTISDASVFVYMDDSMETWADSVEKSIDLDSLTVVKSAGNMLLMAGTADEDDEGSDDGHTHEHDSRVWLSPKRAITLIENIRDAFAVKYPDRADTFNSNAAAYIGKLDDLDAEYTEVLSNAKRTSFVTQHAAFGYLALDYSLTQIPITGVSAESEPSVKRLASLTKYIKKHDTECIYFEEDASSKVTSTLVGEAGVKTAVLNSIESLTNKQTKVGEDYFSAMEEDLKVLQLTTDVAGKTIKAETDITETVQDDYLKDKNVTDRSLSDWSSKWQPVYPYLLDGTLDQVWEYKAKVPKGEETSEEYKEYYTIGYKTGVEQINISGRKNTITFIKSSEKCKLTYKYADYKILTYERGDRGACYLFETDDGNVGEFKYVQFSDHNITTTDAEHFYIFWGGESQDVSPKEMDNWPIYYPTSLTDQEIAQEIVAH